MEQSNTALLVLTIETSRNPLPPANAFVAIMAAQSPHVMATGFPQKQYRRVPYLSFGPIDKAYYVFCDLSVREKDWRDKPGL